MIKSKEIYLDDSYPTEMRVNDLLSKMTLQEKFREIGMYSASRLIEDKNFSKELAAQYFNNMGIGAIEAPRLSPQENAAIINELQKYLIENTRLGIPALVISECLHGYMSPGATVFPQSIALGSTWNEALVKEVAEAIAKEASACGVRQGLAPDLDLARESRWGRVEETFGEDPFLCGALGYQYIIGLQGEPGMFREGRIAATVKHYAAHGSPEGGLNLSPVSAGERQLRELYLPPFKKAIAEAGALSVMPAYSEIDGIPCHCSDFLLTSILREEWGFKGYVFSDYGGVGMLHTFHKTAETAGEAGEQALKAGTDLEAPFIYCFGDELMRKAESGEIGIDIINRAVSRVLYVKFRIGLFERPYVDVQKATQIVNCREHRNLALKTAHESIVLLKNRGGLLPLSRMIDSIAVIGPNADTVQLGDYSIPDGKEVTLLQGIRNRASANTEIHYAKGCELYGTNTDGFHEAVEAARRSKVAIVAIGTSSTIQAGVGWGEDKGEIVTCGEGFDWADLKIPELQEKLVKAVYETGTPTVVVMINGRPLTFDFIPEHIPAVLEAWYPGEEGGNALADIIFGDVNPSGKLPVTFPKITGQTPVYYNHKPSAGGIYHLPGTVQKPGRDYVFNDPKPLYEFGFGLSYTQFEYSNLRVTPDEISAGDTVTVCVCVKNCGFREGKETVQLYINDVYSSVTTPVRALKGFKKICLKAGEMQEVCFTLTPKEMCLINRDMQEIIEPGVFEVMIGNLKAEFLVRR